MKPDVEKTLLSKAKPIILITGKPGVGKSTAVKKIIHELDDKAGGFYTREIKENDSRLGFEIVTLAGKVARLAIKSSKTVFSNEVSFERYKVNLDALNLIGVPALHVAVAKGQIIVIDEIGPMEILSIEFQNAVTQILNNNELAVIGTIVERSYEFADQVKVNPRVNLIHMNSDNRGELPSQILDILLGNSHE